MTTQEIGAQLVELCKKGENAKAIELLYAKDVVSVEAAAMPNLPREMKGKDAVLGKNKWWAENHTIHAVGCDGPYPHDDRFAVRFSSDVTNTQSKQRIKMEEIGLYTVKDGKIVREEFFYAM